MPTFHLFGIPVIVSPWTLILCAIVTLDAFLYIRKHHPQQNKWAYALPAFIVMELVILSVVLHEVMHAVVAYSFGIPIVESGIDWWGAYVKPAGGLNDMSWIAEFMISFAGPATNIIIGAVAAWYVSVQPESMTENTIQYLAYVNIKLARFNLFPLVVTDGGHMVDAILRVIIPSEDVRIIANLVIAIVFIGWYFFIRDRRQPSLEDGLSRL